MLESIISSLKEGVSTKDLHSMCMHLPELDYVILIQQLTIKALPMQLAPLKTELVAYSRFTPVIPMGLGMRFKVGPFMNLSFEGGYRTTFTDYLDDVSTVHHTSGFADPIALALSDRRPEIGLPVAADGSKRGNPATNDAYFLFNAKIEYYLPVNFLQGGNKGAKTFKNKRKSYYRYNKRGGLKK